MSKNPKPLRGRNQLANMIVDMRANDESPVEVVFVKEKNAAVLELWRLWGIKGGTKRGPISSLPKGIHR
jgi:hypothetical protein